MCSPLISVIIPVYNVEDYLEECLNSIINQTFTDIEIICINDGSTDKSANILEEYALKDSRIIVVHQENQKLAIARNNGLQIAKGKYISFVDSDDFLDLQTYEVLSQQLGKADLLAFAGQSFVTDDNKNSLRQLKGGYEAPFVGKKSLTDDIKKVMPTSVCMKIFKKEILDTSNITFPCGLRYEDNAFTFNYLAVSESIYYFKEAFYKRRVHENSIMGSTISQKSTSIDILHVCDNIHTFLVKHDLFRANEKLFAEKVKNSVKFAMRHSIQSKKDEIFQQYEIYISSFFGNSPHYDSCIEYGRKMKDKYVFSPMKYYSFKLLSLLTFGKAKESFCRKCSMQLDFKR